MQSRPVLFVLTLVAVGCLGLLSLRIGIRPVDWSTTLGALLAYEPTNPDHIAIRELRLPRTLAALLAGAALGLAGALMQVVTRNPLADPGLLGINGGAALGVVIAIWGVGVASQAALVLPALAGAALASVLVLTLGGAMDRQGVDPIRLVLAGAAVGALFLALTWALLMLSRETLDVYRFWVLGGFNGINGQDLLAVGPFYAAGAALAVVAVLALDPLLLGDDTARSLGVRVGLVRLITIAAIIGLCGSTVAMAGPVAFIGLIVPHLARSFSGADIRKLALFSAAIGSALALVADIAGRVIIPGQEIQAGAMVALIGGPALVLLVRQHRAVPL